MTNSGWLIRLSIGVLIAAVFLTLFTMPGAAAETDPPDVQYHAADLLKDGSQEVADKPITLVLDGTVTEGDVIEIAINENERNAFDITNATDKTDEIGVTVGHTDDTIEIEFTDLGGNGSVTGAEITITASLRATDSVASGASVYDTTTIATVNDNGTDVGLGGESAMTVSITEAAEIGFTAEEIDNNLDGKYHETDELDQFALSFDNDTVVDDGESINLSINPNLIKNIEKSAIGIRNVGRWATEDQNISHISVSESGDANILEGHSDQITITIYTVDGERRSISNEAIAINIQLIIDEELMKQTANRYHNADFLEVDVEGENNTELTDNTDILTESPLLVDIYPSEVTQFELEQPKPEGEVGISENRTIEIETAQDRFGNEVRAPTLEATLSGGKENYTYAGIGIDTADRKGPDIGVNREIGSRVGVFDLTVEITDIEGPATHAEGTVTATIDDLAIYPDNVTVRTIGASSDFDAGGGDIELAVDLGVTDETIDRVDLELRRLTGGGTVMVDRAGGTPTQTDLWEDTEYAGDGEMRPENTWVIERNLTGSDFDDGVRTYTLKTDTADRYEIAADVMPYEGRLVANETDIRSSTVRTHENATQGSVEIVATGPVDSVANVTVRTNHEFIGTETDQGGNIAVGFEGFIDANGNRISETNETLAVGIGNETITEGVGAGSATGTVGPPANSSTATVSFDPTEIDTTAVETGSNATVAIMFDEGRQLNTTEITLVHRAVESDGSGWQPGSVPQPATLYVDADGARDITHWNATAERYESLADGAEDDVFESYRIEPEHLHRGFYFRSTDNDTRIGFDFVTDGQTPTNGSAEAEGIELDEGWHFGSSNYDISAHKNRDLADDLNWSDYGFDKNDDAFIVRNSSSDRRHDRTSGTGLDGTETGVGHDGTYWIRVLNDTDAPLVREVSSPAFTEKKGVQE